MHPVMQGEGKLAGPLMPVCRLANSWLYFRFEQHHFATMKKLSAQYLNCFPQALRAKNGLRLIGREAEFPVVDAATQEAGDVQVRASQIT